MIKFTQVYIYLIVLHTDFIMLVDLKEKKAISMVFSGILGLFLF